MPMGSPTTGCGRSGRVTAAAAQTGRLSWCRWSEPTDRRSGGGHQPDRTGKALGSAGTNEHVGVGGFAPWQ